MSNSVFKKLKDRTVFPAQHPFGARRAWVLAAAAAPRGAALVPHVQALTARILFNPRDFP